MAGGESVYDLAGRLVQSFDGDNNETDYSYDAAGDQTGVSVRAPRGPGNTPGAVVSQTTCVYDLAGQLVETVDGAGHATAYGYDAAGRQLSETTAYGTATAATTTYAYDDAGNLISATDPDHNTTTYAYNALGAQTSVTSPTGDA